MGGDLDNHAIGGVVAKYQVLGVNRLIVSIAETDRLASAQWDKGSTATTTVVAIFALPDREICSVNSIVTIRVTKRVQINGGGETNIGLPSQEIRSVYEATAIEVGSGRLLR
ncbi:hypothetical protein [Adhaeretor mobilis]|uniref:Uncharacterized protein n=1 Tax=Adhaeretor mobilis TaxID=1930276 RepID=A0A517N198_9BACT|nr:hypothetical protein [Adhaeretor mobilis]QDT00906.1 hypothetical protein HG15A2_42480 [Adhaeretor mobilis]